MPSSCLVKRCYGIHLYLLISLPVLYVKFLAETLTQEQGFTRSLMGGCVPYLAVVSPPSQ